ncbi:DUF4177 domain-containing protein [Clostridioides difficile]|nr:DUF4177 domain-containing protein [Clostridioides difficile]
MKKYEYVTLSYESQFLVTGVMKEHRTIIEEYAKKGYRYIGFIPIEINSHGFTRKIDLVFEIEE